MNLLVVEDNLLICRAMHRYLNTHEVTSETRPDLALDRILRGDRYDAILCDLLMPEMTGIAFYTYVRDAAPDQARRIIFMTAAADDARLKPMLDALPNPYLAKPIDVARLRKLLDDLL
jgi:CheY-like chemotaxis protein